MFEPDQQRMNIDIVKKENTFDDDNTVFTENESTFGGSSHWNDFDDSDSSSWDSDEDDSDLDEELERIVSSSLVGKKKPKVRGKIHAGKMIMFLRCINSDLLPSSLSYTFLFLKKQITPRPYLHFLLPT